MRTLDPLIDLVNPSCRAALRVLPVRVGDDTHDLLLWDTRILATSSFAPADDAIGSEAVSFLESRLSNALWVGGLQDGDYLLSDIDDMSLTDAPQYSLPALLEAGLPIKSLDAASVDWTQVVSGVPIDTGGWSLFSAAATQLVQDTSSLVGPGKLPFSPSSQAARDRQMAVIKIIAEVLHQYVSGRGVIELVVDHSDVAPRVLGATDDWGAVSLLPLIPYRRFSAPGRFVEVTEVGFNLTLRSVTFYPFDSTQHDHHRVEKVVRIRPSHGRYALEHYLVAGPIVTTPPYFGVQHNAGMSSLPAVSSSFNTPANLAVLGVPLATGNQLAYVSSSTAAPSVRWKAGTPFRLLASSTTYSGLAYRMSSLVPDPTPFAVGAYPAPVGLPGLAATAQYGVLTKPAFLRVLESAVSGYEEPDRSQRLTEIANLDASADASLRCVCVQFAAGIPGTADCVEQLALYRAARTGPVLVDVLSAVVDGDDTLRSVRNRARKSVAPLGIAYLMTADGEDWTGVLDSAAGFGPELRAQLAARPQKYRLTLSADHVLVTTRRFVSTVATLPFVDLANPQLGALWQDVQDAIERGTPVVPDSYGLLAKLIAPGLTDTERTTLAATMAVTAGRELLTSIAHPLYMGAWLWDCKPVGFTPSMYVGVVAERSGELFSKVYNCFAAYVRGPRTQRVLRSYDVNFLVNDQLDI